LFRHRIYFMQTRISVKGFGLIAFIKTPFLKIGFPIYSRFVSNLYSKEQIVNSYN